MGGDSAVGGGGHYLSQGLGAHVARGKHACDIGFCGFVRHDIARLVKCQLRGQGGGCGLSADADEDAVHFDLADLVRYQVAKLATRYASVGKDLFQNSIAQKLHVFRLHKGLVVNFCGAEGVASVNEIHLFRKSGEVKRVRDRRIAATDHHNGLVLIKSAVAMRAVMHAASEKRRFALKTQLTRVSARGENDRARPNFTAVCYQLLDLARKLCRKQLAVFCDCAKSLCTRLHFHTERKPVNALVKAGVVVNVVGQRHLSARTHALQHQRVKPRARGVQRRRITRSASADNNCIVNVFHKDTPLYYLFYYNTFYGKCANFSVMRSPNRVGARVDKKMILRYNNYDYAH